MITLTAVAVILAGCSAGGGALTATEALSKLEQAGLSCAEKTEWGTFGSSEKGFSCKDFADSLTGFRMSFGADAQEFGTLLADYCVARAEDAPELQGIFGENWVATIDAGSNVEYSDLSNALGGNLMTFQEACS